MIDPSGEPYLALVRRCECRRELTVRVSLKWVNWMRRTLARAQEAFGGPAFTHRCRCGRYTTIMAEDLYLGVEE